MTRRSNQCGFSYVEVLVAVALIAIIVTPLGEALWSAMSTSEANVEDTSAYYQLLKATEDTLTRDYSALLALADAHDVVVQTTTTDGGALVNLYISLYDGDNADGDNDPFSGTDDGLLWIRVELAGTARSFETLKAQ